MLTLPIKKWRKKKALANANSDVMTKYLSAPLPDAKTPLSELEIVALDLETTGLDPKKDSILSVGIVLIRREAIQLNTTRHQIISVAESIPEASAVIHRITDDQSAAGEPIEKVLPWLLKQLAGKVMLVHYKNIEQNFLNEACQKLYGSPFIIATIDTLPLAQRLLERRNYTIQSGNLRLFNLRSMFGLPNYQAHNALYDALATAELYLALMAELSPTGSYRLKDITT